MFHFSSVSTPCAVFCTVLASFVWFVLTLALKRRKYFLPLCGVTHSVGVFIFAFNGKTTRDELFAFLCALTALTCFFYLCLCLYTDVLVALIKRKKRLLEEGQQRLFTLPDRENSFVQERLHTALQAPQKEENSMVSSQLHLEYLRKIIGKLKSAKLTPSDRLAVENYSRLITCYMSASQLSVREIQGLNDCFAALLKLSAKYAV